jgi:hypothetical protein
MAMVTACEGERVAYRGDVYGPEDGEFEMDDSVALECAARGLVVIAGAGSTDPAPAPPATIAAEPEPAEPEPAELEPEVIKVPIGPKPRGRKHDRTEEGD